MLDKYRKNTEVGETDYATFACVKHIIRAFLRPD